MSRSLSYNPSPTPPRLRLPAMACDAHVHVFGPQARFPLAADRRYTPCEAPMETLFALHAVLGIERCVIVQPSPYGFDNSATTEALAARRGAYAGVALVPTTVSEAELRRLDAAGFRGVRFHFLRSGTPTPIADVIEFSKRLAPIGWHLQIHLDSTFIRDLAPALRRSAVPVVIDHMGRVDASLGVDQPEFRSLRELLRDSRFWVKVSGADRVSRVGSPYADAIPFARALVADAGDRVVWGSDWPHPNQNHVPDDGVLVDLIESIALSQAARHQLLVSNPQRLYRFSDQA